MAGTLSVELSRAEVDVGGSVAVNPGPRLDTVGTSVAGIEGDRLEDGEHLCMQVRSLFLIELKP